MIFKKVSSKNSINPFKPIDVKIGQSAKGKGQKSK